MKLHLKFFLFLALPLQIMVLFGSVYQVVASDDQEVSRILDHAINNNGVKETKQIEIKDKELILTRRNNND